MSTFPESETLAKMRSAVPRVLLWLVLSIVVVVAGASGYTYYMAYSALPQLDGQLKLPGLSEPVAASMVGTPWPSGHRRWRTVMA